MAPSAWREPARALPLRWGSYEGRYLLGLIYIVAGMLLLAGSNTYAVPLLLFGTIAQVGGWYILPGRGVRRAWMAWVGLLGGFLLLPGPQWLTVLTLPVLAWLVVRQRPLLAYLALLIPIGFGVVLANLFFTSQDQPVALAIAGVGAVGAAWVARAIAVARARRFSTHRSGR